MLCPILCHVPTSLCIYSLLCPIICRHRTLFARVSAFSLPCQLFRVKGESFRLFISSDFLQSSSIRGKYLCGCISWKCFKCWKKELTQLFPCWSSLALCATMICFATSWSVKLAVMLSLSSVFLHSLRVEWMEGKKIHSVSLCLCLSVALWCTASLLLWPSTISSFTCRLVSKMNVCNLAQIKSNSAFLLDGLLWRKNLHTISQNSKSVVLIQFSFN